MNKPNEIPPSVLAAANRDLREGRHDQAIRQYVSALQELPAFGAIISANLDIARARFRRDRHTKPKLRVTVCGWDLSHNAAGRALTLAHMYETFADVAIVGSAFTASGPALWEPLGSARSRVQTFRVNDHAKFLEQALQLVLAHPCDVVHLSKPRAPNIFFGILFKLLWGARVIVDIDDDELAFVGKSQPKNHSERRTDIDRSPELAELDGTLWTELAVAMAGRFDAVTVANSELQDVFGGELVRHARDERRTNVSAARKAEIRQELGLALDAKVVLFLGTPRKHKGLLQVADAIRSLGRADVVFVVIGTFADLELKAQLLSMTGVVVRLFEDKPIDKVHEYASIGDVCVLMQDSGSQVSQFQTPAKLSDALAAGMVVLATPVPGLKDLMHDGAVIPVTSASLPTTLARAFDDVQFATNAIIAARRAHLEHLSFATNVPRLRALASRAAPAWPDPIAEGLFKSAFFFGTWLKFLRSSARPSQGDTAEIGMGPYGLKPALPASTGGRQSHDAPGAPLLPSPVVPPAVKPTKSESTGQTVQRKLPITVLVITWDIGHNPLGRSYMLAEALDRVARNVVLVGFQFPRYGDDIWEPVRAGRLPVISLPGSNLPEFLDAIDRTVERIRPDVVVSCKPRLPSMLFGLQLKRRWGCPLVVDVDDHELSFFKNREPLTLDALAAMPQGNACNVQEPYEELWTRLSETLCQHAEEILVSNVALHRKFNGTLIPHVRDEKLFNPSNHDRAQSRRRYGIDVDAKVVLFFGTPRAHKGIDDLARAVGRMQADARLVVVGNAPDRGVTNNLNKLAPNRVVYLPNQPFSDIPAVMAIADIVCLPQDTAHPISQFQLPAKAIDAVAMGIPLLVTRTPPLLQLVDDGVAVAVDKDRIAEDLQAWLEDTSRLAGWGPATRARFLSDYSYQAAGERLRSVLQRAMAKHGRPAAIPLEADLASLIRRAVTNTAPVPASTADRSSGIDIVLFWKQNDTGLYGRRHDMVIKYLATRADVRRVVVFDAPLSEGDLIRWRETENSSTQDRFIYVKTYEKLLGTLDGPKVNFNVFVHPPGQYAGPKAPQLLQDYAEFIRTVLRRENVKADRSVFWVYPRNFHATALIEQFRPWKTVVDVVDDHRAWPGTSDEEKIRLTNNYRDLLARAQMAFANCEPVQSSMSEFHQNVRLVPNGCDADPPTVLPKHNTAFNDFMAWKGPTIGFVGNLEAKIDLELIAKLAEHFRACQIVLIGSTHANPAARELTRYRNIRMPGVVAYEEVGAWVSKFDVGLVPHIKMPMTSNMNPLKVYVYLALNIPVVSTKVENVDRDSDLVHIATNHEEFISAVARRLKIGRPKLETSQAYVTLNSWRSRLESHVNELLMSK